MTEGRTLALAGTATLLALAVVTACALAGISAARAPLAAAAVWVALAFSGVQAAAAAYEREERAGTLAALLCGPIRSLSLYLGKTVGIALHTVTGAWIAVLLSSLLLHAAALSQAPARLLLIVFLGAVGFSLVGGMVAPLLGLGAGREALLSLVLLPLGVPIIVSGARAMMALAQKAPALDVYQDSLGIIAGLDLLYLLLALWLFDPLIRRGRQEG